MVLFRVDASQEIGTGHVMRCLALADRLQNAGVTPVFVARKMFDNLATRIASAGFALERLPPASGVNDRPMPHAHWLAADWREDARATAALADRLGARWIVIDHYGIDRAWQAAVAAPSRRVAVFDDLADRPHACDLLVDPSLTGDAQGRYRPLLGPGTERLFSPRYAILRPEFAKAPDRTGPRTPPRWLIAFGGVDAAGMTGLALEALAGAGDVDVIVGGQNQALDTLRPTIAGKGWRLHVDTAEIGGLMGGADLAIGAGGHMLWERAAMGLPSIAIVVAENQREQVAEAASQGLVVSVAADGLSADNLAEAAIQLANDLERRRTMSETCRQAVDGGGADRIASRIAATPVTVRTAAPEDCEDIWRWRNDPAIRETSRDPAAIDLADHERWFEMALDDPSRILLIGEDAKGPLGVVRFDRDGDEAEVSIYLVPQRLGESRGARLLLEAEAWLAGAAPKRLAAETLPDNLPSAALFRAAGYDGNGTRFVKELAT